MNKYDALSRSQILAAIHDHEQDMIGIPRNSKQYTRLHTALSQLCLALQRKTDTLLTKWRESPII